MVEEYRTRAEEHVRRTAGALGVRPATIDTLVRQHLDHVRGVAATSLLDREVGLAGTRLLDVGAGLGELVVCALERGADAYGIEPDADAAAIARLLLESRGHDPERVQAGVGETLPHDDASFDVVTCHNVLEHVRDVRAVVTELTRVVRPGGHVLVSVPNYLFPYEGHYRMKWVPLAPKRIAAFFLRRMGRDPRFLLEHVTYTTYPRMVREWRWHALQSRNLTEEDVRANRHPNALYRSRFWRFAALHLKLYPNVTWLLTKPGAAES